MVLIIDLQFYTARCEEAGVDGSMTCPPRIIAPGGLNVMILVVVAVILAFVISKWRPGIPFVAC